MPKPPECFGPRPRKKPGSTTIYTRLPNDLVQQVRQRAEIERRDMKNMVQVLIERGLREPAPTCQGKPA